MLDTAGYVKDANPYLLFEFEITWLVYTVISVRHDKLSISEAWSTIRVIFVIHWIFILRF